MTKVFTISLPDDFSSELDMVAIMLERPKSYLIREAIEQYIHEYRDYLIALNRYNDKDDEVISSKELKDNLEQ
jgi:RHH-type transcriptional regulator, rel operon repressor / antitoxin RelB